MYFFVEFILRNGFVILYQVLVDRAMHVHVQLRFILCMILVFVEVLYKSMTQLLHSKLTCVEHLDEKLQVSNKF